MTRFAKVFVVFVAAASLGFAAFALAMFAGGPNWQAWASDPAIADTISIVGSETGTYTATARVSGDQIASGTNLADVVLKVQARRLADLRTELQDLQDKMARFGPQRESVKQLIEMDEAGLKKHAELWASQLAALAQQITEMTDNLAQTGNEALQLQEQLKSLRFEVLRTRNQLELLRDDLYVAQVQQTALENELLLLQENRKRLERRQEGLKQQLDGATY